MRKNTPLPIPAYFRMQTVVREEIEKGRWKPGEAIPTERALAEEHRISIGTVKKALLNLTHEGYLYRIQGKGTFVAGTITRENLRYYRLVEHFGGIEAAMKIRFLSLTSVKCPEAARTCLGIGQKQPAFELRRLFIFNQRPVIYNISYLPEALFKNLGRLPETLFETTPLYIALENHYGLPTLHNQELFNAVPAGEEVAAILDVPKETPVLHIEMISFTYKDKPYEYRQAYCLTTRQKVFREI
jgi:GntR family transcriptional regulator